MKILIVCQPLHNRGDESAHRALVRMLLKKISYCDITVLFVDEDQDSVNQFSVESDRVHYINIQHKHGFGLTAIPGLQHGMYMLWHFGTHRQIRNIYKKTDYVICAPGGICMGGFQNWMHLYFLKMAQLTNKPLIYFGRSFGPFPTKTKQNRRFKEVSIEMLNYFSFLSIRDSKTEALADKMGFHDYTKTVDSAFMDSPNMKIPMKVNEMINGSPYIVFVPNLLVWHFNFKGRITKDTVLQFYNDLIDIMFERYPNHKMLMLPQTFNYEQYNGSRENDDIHFMEELAEKKNNARIVVIPDTYSSDIQQAIISKCDFLCGARYHSVVFAINQAIPFIALSYEHKIAGLLDTLSMKEAMIDISHGLDNASAIERTKSLFKEKIQTANRRYDVREKAKEIAIAGFDSMLRSMNHQQN
jgi:colanic acid/amylovoran biosynthesis protein